MTKKRLGYVLLWFTVFIALMVGANFGLGIEPILFLQIAFVLLCALAILGLIILICWGGLRNLLEWKNRDSISYSTTGQWQIEFDEFEIERLDSPGECSDVIAGLRSGVDLKVDGLANRDRFVAKPRYPESGDMSFHCWLALTAPVP